MKHVYMKIALIIWWLCLSITTLAGRDGGGGGALSCDPNLSYGLPPMRLLEFWEAEEVDAQSGKPLLPFTKKLNIIRTDLPVETQIKNAISKLKRINPLFGKKVEDAYKYIKDPKHHEARRDKKTGRSFKVAPPTDTLQPFFPEGCRPVGIGSYSDLSNVDRLHYDEDYLKEMPNTDQSGFWTHESIYFVLRREEGQQNSIETRVINAYLYSDEKLTPINAKPKWASHSFYCENNPDLMVKIATYYKYHNKYFLHTDGRRVEAVPYYNTGRILTGDAEYASYTQTNYLFRQSIDLKSPELAQLLSGFSEAIKKSNGQLMPPFPLRLSKGVVPQKSSIANIPYKTDYNSLDDGKYSKFNLRYFLVRPHLYTSDIDDSPIPYGKIGVNLALSGTFGDFLLEDNMDQYVADDENELENSAPARLMTKGLISVCTPY